ncbi:group III truncated hemoglobin [Taibaiella chishuiensis]|uniref:Hemoglobin n=1 Tax=Taibaiella chishuiensis TaxID=1434707 RepID=A0A2P8DBZ9_9BACT|nr:group III truncated hemoglobin [Taibaiella chishuiensis]PSK94742.1 hemoglobin [Taibaiella chishuiensis]
MDIRNREDIELLVNEFYTAIRGDELLGPIFNGVIGDRWSYHLEKMYSFWETVLLGNHTYSGAPFMPHARLPLEQRHFDRWLQLFDQTADRHFEGDIADDAKARAAKMAVMFLAKINYLKEHGQFRPLA